MRIRDKIKEVEKYLEELEEIQNDSKEFIKSIKNIMKIR